MPIQCDRIIRQALSRQMTEPEIDEFLASVQGMFEKMDAARASPGDKAAKLEFEAMKKKVRAMASARAAMIQQQKRLSNLDLVLNDYGGMEWRGIESLIVGSQYNRKASHYSVDSLAMSLEGHYLASLAAEIRQLSDGHFAIFQKGSLDRDIFDAMWKLEKPGDYTGPKEAMDIARVVGKWEERARLDQNRAGAAILKLPGYIVKQSHDQAKILKAGPEKWKEFIGARLDWSRTCDGLYDPAKDPEAADKFLQNLWEAFSSGIHERHEGSLPNPLMSASAVGTTAAKLNANRVLHFRDGVAAFEYNQAYGQGSLREALLSGFHRAAGAAALMHQFGPSPRAGFENLVKDVGIALKKQGRHQEAADLSKKMERLHNDYVTVDGSINIAGNPTLASIGRNIRTWNNMTKLGGVLISSLTDIPSFATEFAYHGEGFFRSLTEGLRLLAGGRGTLEQQGVLADCGVFFDSISAELAARFGDAQTADGKLAAMSNLFFRINGLSWWTDAWKKAAGLMLSHNLARWSGTAWKDLGRPQSRLLHMYGIDEAGWDLIRQAPKRAADGRDYLTPSAARQIPEADIAAHLKSAGREASPGAIDEWRDNLESRLRALIRDRVSYAVLEPNARSRAFLYQGKAAGTPLGEALRLVLQFKSFPTAFMQKLFGRELLGRESATYTGGLLNALVSDRFGERSNFARMFLMMTLFGYGAMSAKQLIAGKTPHDPKDPKTWLAAAAQGGGLGIFGDFLFAEKSRVGSSFYSTLGGPTLSQMESLQNLYVSVRDGADAKAEALRMLINTTPGNNIFYVRPVFDYLVGYNLFEMLNPGYISRTRRRIKRENGQTFWLEPKKW